MDLGEQKADEVVALKFDHELVDRRFFTSGEDVNRNDVATYGTDSTRDCTQRTGSIWELDLEQVAAHLSIVGTSRFDSVTRQ